jgi:hypothetical protein
VKRVRKLYYVPIIHTSADMGSLAPFLDKTSAAELGRDIWQRHREVVEGFWDAIAIFLESLDVKGIKIYQDGLVVDGVAGRSLVRQGSRQGSRNYQLIERLLAKGAVLVKTEDLDLIREEHGYIAEIARARSPREREAAAQRYRRAEALLLQKRDDLIAARIEETLGEGETGVLFIGAHHDVLAKLPLDMEKIQVKDLAKVREYHRALTDPRRHEGDLQRLAEYLQAPVIYDV